MKYKRVDLKKSFYVSRGELINYTIKVLNTGDLEDPKTSFDTKSEPKYLNETEAKSEVKKYILSTRVIQYI